MAAYVLVPLVALTLAGGGAAKRMVASSATAVTFTNANHVTTTLEGCRNDGNPAISLPDGNGDFICPDAAYTTGNLANLWAELDLVPHRLTTTLGTQADATTNYNLIIAADYLLNGSKGYDVISAPVVNTAKSDASCQVSADPQVVSAGVTGGADSTISRTLSITQDKGTTCVFDYYQRLALGAHDYPGSSLQSYLFDTSDFNGGKKTVPLPVSKTEFPAQSIAKDMAASEGSDHVWDVTKTPTPATIDFPNTCDPSAALSTGVSIKIEWTLAAATPSGPITVITHVYVTNPAARVVTTSVSDDIQSGTTVLDTATSGPVDVPANTGSFLVLTHQTTVAEGTSDLNDVATATYTDKITGVPVPGNTTATASANVQLSGTELNKTAVINDVESITGSNLQFSTDSFSGASGAFDGGYVAGTKTTGSVSWTSDSQSGGGDVTFAKTIYVGAGASGSGKLSDTATLTANDGFATHADLDVNISASKSVELTITKNIPNILTGSETQSFTFDVYDGSNTKVDSKTLLFAANDTQKSVTLKDLKPDTYTVKEVAASGWKSQSDQSIDLTSNCSDGATFTNSLNPANAKAVKVTDPSGYQKDWEMILSGPGTPQGGEKVKTDASGNASFLTELQQGSYTITETLQTGWAQKSATGDCSFTVNYPADSGKLFTCTITNKSRGHVKVIKTINLAPPVVTQSFAFQIRDGASTTQAGTIVESGTASAANGGVINFSSDLLPGHTYALCEIVMPGWMTTLGPPFYVVYNPSGDNSTVCTDFSFNPGDTASPITFSIDNKPPPGGLGRTIGFWKNWASCAASSGGQKPVLDQTLAKAEPGGVTIGVLTLHGSTATPNKAPDCAKAVNLLNKTTIDGKKKMSSDPLFNLAAQLIAAKLNVVAGAGTCPSAVTAINSAQTLLVKYSFNGLTYSPKLSSADASLANSLATALDKYNNNTLC